MHISTRRSNAQNLTRSRRAVLLSLPSAVTNSARNKRISAKFSMMSWLLSWLAPHRTELMLFHRFPTFCFQNARLAKLWLRRERSPLTSLSAMSTSILPPAINSNGRATWSSRGATYATHLVVSGNHMRASRGYVKTHVGEGNQTCGALITYVLAQVAHALKSVSSAEEHRDDGRPYRLQVRRTRIVHEGQTLRLLASATGTVDRK